MAIKIIDNTSTQIKSELTDHIDTQISNEEYINVITPDHIIQVYADVIYIYDHTDTIIKKIKV